MLSFFNPTSFFLFHVQNSSSHHDIRYFHTQARPKQKIIPNEDLQASHSAFQIPHYSKRTAQIAQKRLAVWDKLSFRENGLSAPSKACKHPHSPKSFPCKTPSKGVLIPNSNQTSPKILPFPAKAPIRQCSPVKSAKCYVMDFIGAQPPKQKTSRKGGSWYSM